MIAQLLITSKDVERTLVKLEALRALPWPLLEAKLASDPIHILCEDPIEHTRQQPYCDGDETCPCHIAEAEEDARDMEHDYWQSV